MRNYLALALTLFALGTATVATTTVQAQPNLTPRTGTAANNAEHNYGGPGFYRAYPYYHHWHYWRR